LGAMEHKMHAHNVCLVRSDRRERRCPQVLEATSSGERRALRACEGIGLRSLAAHTGGKTFHAETQR
jgi:hypothetical protein